MLYLGTLQGRVAYGNADDENGPKRHVRRRWGPFSTTLTLPANPTRYPPVGVRVYVGYIKPNPYPGVFATRANP